MKAAIVVGIVLLAGALTGLVAVQGGFLNFAADEPHSKLVHGLIETARESFIERRARQVSVPPLDDEAMIARGARHYAPMCAGCHLAPGSNDTEVRQGLYPRPPRLAGHMRDHPGHGDGPASAARQFWIIKHGIKASGMPAWGTTHDDESIWAIVAFLQALPGMSPEQYLALTESGDGSARPAVSQEPAGSPDTTSLPAHGQQGHAHAH